MEPEITVDYLRRKDTALASILNDMFDGVYIVDRHRRILFWNKGAEEITGYSAEEVEGKWCGDDVLNHIDEDGNLMCKSACPLTETIATGARATKKAYPRHRSGRRFPTMTHAAPIRNAQGEIIAGVEVFRDISGEEEFRLLQEKFNTVLSKNVSAATLEDVMAQVKGEAASRASARDLSILYLDVVAFTKFSEENSAVDSVILLNAIFGICEVITTEFHGDLNKFIGDCIMAVFIDANDAVNAAKKMLAALKRFNAIRRAEGEQEVAVRIGIHSGLAIQGSVGEQGSKERTVIGDVVNTASHIQPLAAPNSICISESTYSRLKDASDFGNERQAVVEGKTEPLTIYSYAAGSDPEGDQ